MKRTKVVCTIGPSSEDYQMLLKMFKAGMNVARLNFSHGSHAEHLNRIETIRKVEKENGVDIAILLDTKGPEIRLGDFENDEEDYRKGDLVTIQREDILGTHDRFTIQCKEVFDDVKAGNYILVNDGKQKLTVLSNDGNEMKCRVEINGPLSSRKGCNIPDVILTMPFISLKDDEDIRFGCEHDVDYIAASFVRRAEDIYAIRKIITEMGKPNISIIAKIENQEGYDNLDEIIDAADGVMVGRGDLGVEIDTALVTLYQKKMIRKCNLAGKCVITATQMLDSMTSNPRPTRAEASDVSNAVLDGTDAVMLSAESASGDYPLEAVEMMSHICEETEKTISYRELLDHKRNHSDHSIQDAIGIAIADATLSLKIAAIVVFTQSGKTARVISKYRPNAPIYAVTFNKSVLNSLETYWGVDPVISRVMNEMHNDDELASSVAKSHGIKPGEQIIISAGYPAGVGSANMMKIITVK